MRIKNIKSKATLVEMATETLRKLEFTSGEGLDHYNAINRLHLLRDRAKVLGFNFRVTNGSVTLRARRKRRAGAHQL